MKKIIAFVLAALMTACCFTAYAADDVDKAKELTALGVYTNFADEATVTRGEAARAIATLASLEPKSSGDAFTDISSNENAPYINALCEAGVVNGCGESTFEPDRAITYEEAITMLVRALGWEPTASRNGGYPNGYLKVAAAGKTGITKGVSGRTGESLTGEKLIGLMYNSLDINKMKQASETEDATEWTAVEGDTFRAALTKVK